MKKIKVLFFGSLSDVSGRSELAYEAIDTVGLKESLEKTYPNLSNYTFRIALNQEIVSDNQKLSDNDVVALMPPFAGG